jgi:hypothetical protein
MMYRLMYVAHIQIEKRHHIDFAGIRLASSPHPFSLVQAAYSLRNKRNALTRVSYSADMAAVKAAPVLLEQQLKCSIARPVDRRDLTSNTANVLSKIKLQVNQPGKQGLPSSTLLIWSHYETKD